MILRENGLHTIHFSSGNPRIWYSNNCDESDLRDPRIWYSNNCDESDLREYLNAWGDWGVIFSERLLISELISSNDLSLVRWMLIIMRIILKGL